MEVDEKVVWCPRCKSEYYAWAKTCSDCLVDLVSELPKEEASSNTHPNPNQPELLVSVADEREAERIIVLLTAHGIPVIRKEIEDDDTGFGIGLYFVEPFMSEAVKVLQHDEDEKGERVFGSDMKDGMQDLRGAHKGLRLFRKVFDEEE